VPHGSELTRDDQCVPALATNHEVVARAESHIRSDHPELAQSLARDEIVKVVE
jgi:hypothetical protein